MTPPAPLRSLTLAALLSLSLVACGNDDSLNGTGSGVRTAQTNTSHTGTGTTTTPTTGTNTSTSAGSTSQPPTTLTLAGTITDAPIAGAQVVASVGSTSASATADGAGNYRLSLTVPASDKALPVTITATGTGAQAKVKLLSLPGAFATLVSNAGTDAVLTDAENIRVNVTNVSTAEAALVIGLNGGQSPINQARQDATVKRVSADALTDLMGVLKLLIDQPGKYTLPGGTVDTLDFAENAKVRDGYIQDIKNNRIQDSSYADLDQAIQDTAANPDLTQPLTAASVPATLVTLAGANNDARFVTNDDCALNTYTFNAGGTGTLVSCDNNDTTQWHLDGHRLIVTPDHAVVTGTDSSTGATLSEARYQYALALLNPNQISAVVTTNSTSSVAGDPPTSTTTDAYAFAVLHPAQDFKTFLPSGFATAGGKVMMTIPLDPDTNTTNLGPYDHDIATFQAGGQGSTLVHGQTFTWTVDANGMLKLTYANGTTLSLHGLNVGFSNQDANTQFLYGDLVTKDGSYVLFMPFIQQQNPFAFTEANSLGTFYYQGIGNQEQGYYNYDARLKGFFQDFLTDHTGCLATDFISSATTNAGAVITPTQNSSGSTCFFRWSLPSGGTRGLQRYFENDQNRQLSNSARSKCDPSTSSTCQAWDRRIDYPFGLVGQRYYWLEAVTTTFDPYSPLDAQDADVFHYNQLYYYDLVTDANASSTSLDTPPASSGAASHPHGAESRKAGVLRRAGGA